MAHIGCIHLTKGSKDDAKSLLGLPLIEARQGRTRAARGEATIVHIIIASFEIFGREWQWRRIIDNRGGFFLTKRGCLIEKPKLYRTRPLPVFSLPLRIFSKLVLPRSVDSMPAGPAKSLRGLFRTVVIEKRAACPSSSQNASRHCDHGHEEIPGCIGPQKPVDTESRGPNTVECRHIC
jgi:hypothetical protein